MNIKIKKQFKSDNIKFNFEKHIKDLLKKIPWEHLVGIQQIVLVDTLKHDNKDVSGLYWQKFRGNPASIEINVFTLFKGMPNIFFFFPLIPKILLAHALYHEIGHHYQYFTHGIKKKEGEEFADRYSREFTKKAFKKWKPILTLFNMLLKTFLRLKILVKINKKIWR